MRRGRDEKGRRPARSVIAIVMSLAGILLAGFAAMAGPASAAAAPAPAAPGVAAGYSHTCAIDVGGALSCWGGNYSGQLGNNANAQLGDGTTTRRPAPQQVTLPS